eukprot:CAMPEP_0202506988 /NCGR_PEP_ID=MMETSP1361-20130828/51484_1 /ASSEMBLY_ACC=CAM_ASM_000849 /TAXON_ID=210615 /ORGANISM="Staurosira complex sp., Strain CCMP2646" /LENGTH=127 /DNA_ID=CAMNT_0049141079 /DNA_START=548 /DNA_END=931 /DNA_ORIENTATION=-
MTAHADAVNLARRLSSRQENDLLQTNLYATSPSESTDDDTTSLQYCQGLAAKLTSVKDLPTACKKYPEVVKTLQRQTTGGKEDSTIAFEGMRPGSAAEARRARSKGREHQAQITRRYTRTETRRKSS